MAPVFVLQLVLGLLAVTGVLALVARRLRVPPASVYVVGGMALAVIPGVPQLVVDPALILALFLPPLLQSSAFFTVWRDFRANLRPILLLATGCVAFTTFLVGVAMKAVAPGLPWAACFTLGAIISPPDAVSAASVLEHLRIPRRLRTILEGESLVNDASGLVLYRFAVAAALTGSFSAGPAALAFFYVAGAGIAVGLVCGRVVTWLTSRLRDVNLEIVATFLVAWASYMAAEEVGASGVLSTVSCGITMGWLQHKRMSSRTRLGARMTWGFVVFVMEALVFVLIGLSLNGVLARLGRSVLELLPLGLLITGTVVAARFVWLFPAVYVPRLLSRRLRARDPAPPWTTPFVMGWAGMRGVVSLALALALPERFPGHDAILFLTFFVILVTVLVQGTTLGAVIRWLGVAQPADRDGLPPEARARVEMERASLRLIEQRATDEIVGPIARDLLTEYRERTGHTARLHQTGGGAVRAERLARLSLRLEAVGASRGHLLAMHGAGDIHDDVLQVLEQELDLEELRFRELLEH